MIRLHVNFEKSVLIVVGEVSNIDMLAMDLGCRVASLLVTYLGLPLGASYKKVDAWNAVIDRIKKRPAGGMEGPIDSY